MRIAAFEGAPTDSPFDRFVIFLRKHTRNVSLESSIKLRSIKLERLSNDFIYFFICSIRLGKVSIKYRWCVIDFSKHVIYILSNVRQVLRKICLFCFKLFISKRFLFWVEGLQLERKCCTIHFYLVNFSYEEIYYDAILVRSVNNIFQFTCNKSV